MKAHFTKLCYQVPLTTKQWKVLNRLSYLNDIVPSLSSVGVLNGSIEYSPHFGRNIFFEVLPETDIQPIIEKLESLLDLK
jgi:hypothetical protein